MHLVELKLKYKKLEVMQMGLKNKSELPAGEWNIILDQSTQSYTVTVDSWQSRLIDTVYFYQWIVILGRRSLKERGPLHTPSRPWRVKSLGFVCSPSFFSLPAACRLFSCGVIFTHAHISLTLLSLRKIGGLFWLYCQHAYMYLINIFFHITNH